MADEPVLRWGSEGDSVVDLQGRLTALGYAPGAGIVGSLTWAALGAGSGSQAPLPSPASSEPAEEHVVFVTDPVVTGLTLTYRAARLDGQPIAAGSGIDVWSIDGDGTPMVANDSVTVPSTDAPDGSYDVAVPLPDLAPGTYTVHVGLMSDSSGSSEVGHATFTA